MRTHIQFYPKGWEWRDCRRARKGLVEGVGTNDADYATNPLINGNRLSCPAYVIWKAMLQRCYNGKRHLPTYVGASVVESWLCFSNFRKWYFQHRDLISYYGYKGRLELDKDILSNSKTYGPSTCILIPRALNCLLLDSRASRGKYPIGVCKDRGRFQARVCIDGDRKRKRKYGFNTPEEAATWRLQTKLEYVENYPLPPWLDEAKVRRRLIEIVRNQK